MKAEEEFKKASTEVQELIKMALSEEREVMHLRRRAEIHKKLYETVKRIVK